MNSTVRTIGGVLAFLMQISVNSVISMKGIYILNYHFIEFYMDLGLAIKDPDISGILEKELYR